jgi:hypothetical protein
MNQPHWRLPQELVPKIIGATCAHSKRQQKVDSMGHEMPSLQERLDMQERHDRDKASTMREGPERDALLRRADKMKRASDITGWLNSSELKAPD